MSEPRGSRTRPGEALRRLHEALPRRANFSVSRGDQWSVVVHQPHPKTGEDQYLRTVIGDDLGALVEEALKLYRQWAAAADTSGQDDRPPGILAPGAAERRRAARSRKDAS